MPEGLSYMARTVAAIVSSIWWMKHFIARIFCIKFKQERTSGHDNAWLSTLSKDADHSSVNARANESFDVKELVKSSSHDYEVFLSFRGPDTRSSFTDFLYTNLIDAGIRVYRDDKELPFGEQIGPELLQAIKQSKILIPIFSKGYAYSKWCLRELVQMVACKNESRQQIIPIFYDVEPKQVREQTSDYGKAFVMHAQNKQFDERTINKWKAALKEVGSMRGWDLTQPTKREEGKFAKSITTTILSKLKKTYLQVPSCLVEVESRVDEIMLWISAHFDETNIIGIHGMGGIGKTTLAKIVYNQLCRSRDFQDCCCFLSNIQETSNQKGIKRLQSQLISDILKTKRPYINNVDEGAKLIEERLSSKKVLLLLDDVNEKIQLNAIMGKRNWYGKGSKLIITTRNKEILNVPEVDWSYELTGLDFNHSLQLFSKHAFRREHPGKEYNDESIKVVHISGGLPLALEVIGSDLYEKDKNFWDDKLKKLKEVPHEDVRKKLMISFEALEDEQKAIFLDIACFFIGFDRRIVTHMWNSCGFFPGQAIEVLMQRSLIKIGDDNRFWMHGQLRDLGRDIVRRESKAKLEKQSRIWEHEQAFDAFTRIKGTRNIEAICLEFDHQSQYSFSNEDFAHLPNLRFLKVDCRNFDVTKGHVIAHWRFLPYNWRSNVIPRKVTSKMPLILSELKWLSWHNFPRVFKLASFCLRKLVILDLSESTITENWDGWSHIKRAKNLKVLNLTGCLKLERTPNFSSHAKLERLILERCVRLAQIDKSIGQLTHLILLNVNYCYKLETLPDEFAKLEVLTELLIEGTSIRHIPEWTGMKKLKILHVGHCRLLYMTSSIGCYISLTRLSLVYTTFTELPDSFEQLVSLLELDLSNSHIRELPNSMGNLMNLKVLRFSNSSLEALLSFIGMLEQLEVIEGQHCALQGEIPSDIVKLPFLKILILTYTKIESVPKLPDSLKSMWFSTSSMTALEDCSNLSELEDLELQCVKKPHELLEDPSPRWIKSLSKLESLVLACPCFTTLSTDFILLSQLKKLVLHRCINLRCLPRLPPSLSHLTISVCGELGTSLDLSNLVALEDLYVANCMKIKEIQGLKGLENLRRMSIIFARSLEKLPDFTNLKRLRKLLLHGCLNVIELTGTSESLETIWVKSCSSLEKLPDPSSFKELKHLSTYRCKRLNDYLNSSDDWRNWTQNSEHIFYKEEESDSKMAQYFGYDSLEAILHRMQYW